MAAMDRTPVQPSEADVDLWRLRRNLALSPEERLEQLRQRVRWIMQHRGIARAAVRPRSEAAGS